MVQSTFECARWTFWRSLDAEIVAICPLTAFFIEANAQYAVKPIYLIVELHLFFSNLRRFDLRNPTVVMSIGS